MQKSLSKVDKSNALVKLAFFVPFIVDATDTILTSSPFLNLWFGKYIAFAGIDL